MRRPLIPVVGAYAAGIVLKYWISSWYLIGCLMFLVLLLVAMVSKKRLHTTIILMIFLLAGSGNLTLKIGYESQLKPFWNEEVLVIGDVIGVSYGDATQIKVHLKEIQLKNQHASLDETTIVRLTGKIEEDVNIVGKRVRTYGVVREPQEARNFNTFDYRMYLKSRDIHSIIYGAVEDLEVMGNGEINPIIESASKIKNKITQVVFTTLKKRDAGLLLGILLGDKEQLEDEIYQNFQLLGAAHVLAVSGLHVGILYMALNYLLKKTNEILRITIILMVLWSYTAVTGFSPSVLRAVTMATFLVIAPLANRRYDVGSSLLVTAFLFLIANPLLIIDVGFQLSFTAVLSITLLYRPMLAKLMFLPKSLAELLAVSAAAQLGTWPIVAYHFNVVSLVAILINIPIVMIMGCLVPIGVILIIMGVLSFSLQGLMGFIVSLILQLVLTIINMSITIPFAFLRIPSPSLWFMTSYVICIGLLIVGKRTMKKYQVHRKKCMYVFMGLYLIHTLAMFLLPHPYSYT